MSPIESDVPFLPIAPTPAVLIVGSSSGGGGICLGGIDLCDDRGNCAGREVMREDPEGTASEL